MQDSQPASFSALDLERFGVPTAKALASTPEEAARAVAFCREARARLLILRCPSDRLDVARILESEGGFLADVLVVCARDLGKSPIPGDPGPFPVRPASFEEAERVASIARQAFKGYRSHYRADPRLDPEACDEVYVSWARRSCLLREVADAVLVAVEGDRPLGFLALRMNNPAECEVLLNGVLPETQGRGLFRTLLIRGMEWSLDHGATRMVSSTQIWNLAVQKTWSRLGFEPVRSVLTFHLWMDAQGNPGRD